MIYVFIALLILVFSFVIALISLIRDSARLEELNKSKLAGSANVPGVAPVSAVLDQAAQPQPQAQDQAPKEVPEPVKAETVPFPWEQNKSSQAAQTPENEDAREPLPWEAPSGGLNSSKSGSLSGEISLKDLKNSN